MEKIIFEPKIILEPEWEERICKKVKNSDPIINDVKYLGDNKYEATCELEEGQMVDLDYKIKVISSCSKGTL